MIRKFAGNSKMVLIRPVSAHQRLVNLIYCDEAAEE